MSDQTLSPVERFRLALAIRLTTMEELLRREGPGYGPAEKKMLTDAYRELSAIMTSTDLTEADINELGYEGQLTGWLKNTLNKIGDIAKNVVTTAAKIVTTPARVLVSGPIVKLFLSVLDKKVSKGLIYYFIPDNSEYLAKNPEVARKTARVKGFLKKLSVGAGISEGEIAALIRDAVVKTTGKSPEEVIKDISTRKDPDLGGGGVSGMGEPVTGAAAIIAALAPIVVAVPSIVGSFKKEDVPQGTDWAAVPPANVNVTGDPTKGTTYVPGAPLPTQDGLPGWAWALIGTGGAAIIGTGVYLATKK